MFKLLASTLADGRDTLACRRTLPRHLVHRMTTLALAVVAVLFAQTV